MKSFFTKDYFLKNREKIIKATAIIVVIVVALFVFFFQSKSNNDKIKIQESEELVIENEEKPAEIIADISGAVVNPKVVELKANSRVDDAIEAAGGLADDADLSNINRAAIVQDGDKIYIPTKSEGGENSIQIDKNDGKININTATALELEKITGVGPATAEKILLYRATNGNFLNIEDIKKVSGIGEKIYEKIKEEIKI